MLDLGYVGAIVGSSLGVLGAITGLLGRLAKTNPEKYLSKLRVMLGIDMVLGWLLIGSAGVIWFGSSTDYERDLAETLFYPGALMLGLLGASSGDLLDQRTQIRKLIHVLLASGLIFLTLGTYSYLVGAASWRRKWELTGGAILLVIYGVSLFLQNQKMKTDDKVQVTP